MIRWCEVKGMLVMKQMMIAGCMIMVMMAVPQKLWAHGDEAGYLVRPGDTLSRILIDRFGHDAPIEQLINQVIQDNQQAFPNGQARSMQAGRRIKLPDDRSGRNGRSGGVRDEIYFFN